MGMGAGFREGDFRQQAGGDLRFRHILKRGLRVISLSEASKAETLLPDPGFRLCNEKSPQRAIRFGYEVSGPKSQFLLLSLPVSH